MPIFDLALRHIRSSRFWGKDGHRSSLGETSSPGVAGTPRLTNEEKVLALELCLDLRGLDEADRLRLADRCEELWVEGGAVLCEEAAAEEGEVASAGGCTAGLYCIVEGLVSVTCRSEHRRAPVVYTLGPGGLFGESALTGEGLLGAEAYRRSRLLRLDRAGIAWALAQLPSFRVVAKRLVRIHRKLPWIVERLRRSALLRNVPPQFVYELLEGADMQDIEPGATLLAAEQDPGGLYLVMTGELWECDRRSQHTIRLLGCGCVFGDLEFMGSHPIEHHVIGGPERSRVLKIDASRLHEMIARSSTFRRLMLAGSSGHEEQRRDFVECVYEHEQRAVNLVAVVGDDPRLPLSTMISWLAEATATEFGDHVVILELDETARGLPVLRRSSHGEGGEVLRLCIHPDSPLLANGAFDRSFQSAHYVLIDDARAGGRPLPARMGQPERTVFVASRPYTRLPQRLAEQLPHAPVYTAVVPGAALPEGEHPWVPTGTVRVHRDVIDAARREVGFVELSERLRRQVCRWARAVTDRRVGLALGGGGAFGFAHLPLLQRVEQAGVPIDLISGCSVGSGVGAYYAVRGFDGLSSFLERAGRVLFTRGLLSSRAIAHFVDEELGAVRLEDLEVPFYPVAVDIDTACQMTIRYGSVGQGVRASASFPGLFTPTLMEHRVPGHRPRTFRFVDGGVVNIVPDDTLYLEGARVALASNVIPPPRSRRATSPALVHRVQSALERLPGAFGLLVREVEPIVRIDDCLRTMYLMMHAPDDWGARTADAKFRAIPGNYSPMRWTGGAAIAEAQRSEHLEAVVARLQASYRALRWQRRLPRAQEPQQQQPDLEVAPLAELQRAVGYG
jgi:predicted acylesterase/phospholipase RssA/CRP-like cAMP-binding protein